MDCLFGVEAFGDEIDAVMRERGVERAEAELIVGQHYGEWRHDLLFLPPLTESNAVAFGARCAR